MPLLLTAKFVTLSLLLDTLLAFPGFPTHSLRADSTVTAPSDSTAVVDSGSAIVLRFGGDVLLAEHYEFGVGDSVSHAFRQLDLLQTADVSMVNLETPVTTRGSRVEKPFNFRMKPRFLRAFTLAGIDIVNIANNHIHDYGPVGLFDTIRHLDSAGILHVGAGRNRKEAHKPVIVEAKGKRIGFLGYYGGGEAPAATRDSAGVARRDLPLIGKDINALRTKDSVDFIVVNLHWGVEKAEEPEPSQVRFARKVVDAGADAIVGHHPHVLQGIECYKSAVIAYSLGNLVFGGNSRSSYDTGLLEIRLEQDTVLYRFNPVRVREWAATELTGAEGDSVIQLVKHRSRMFPKTIFTTEEIR